jgi:hypothetical protein
MWDRALVSRQKLRVMTAEFTELPCLMTEMSWLSNKTICDEVVEECGKGYISFAHVPRANAALLQFSRKHASHRLTHTAHLPLALRVAFVLVLSFYFEHCAAHEDRAWTRPARASHDSFAEEVRPSAALAHRGYAAQSLRLPFHEMDIIGN